MKINSKYPHLIILKKKLSSNGKKNPIIAYDMLNFVLNIGVKKNCELNNLSIKTFVGEKIN